MSRNQCHWCRFAALTSSHNVRSDQSALQKTFLPVANSPCGNRCAGHFLRGSEKRTNAFDLAVSLHVGRCPRARAFFTGEMKAPSSCCSHSAAADCCFDFVPSFVERNMTQQGGRGPPPLARRSFLPCCAACSVSASAAVKPGGTFTDAAVWVSVLLVLCRCSLIFLHSSIVARKK